MSFATRNLSEFHCGRNTATQPAIYLRVGTFVFDLDEVLPLIAQLCHDGTTGCLSATNFLGEEQRQRAGLQTTTITQAVCLDEEGLTIGSRLNRVQIDELSDFIGWLVEQVTWIQDSPSPLTCWDDDLRVRLMAAKGRFEALTP